MKREKGVVVIWSKLEKKIKEDNNYYIIIFLLFKKGIGKRGRLFIIFPKLNPNPKSFKLAAAVALLQIVAVESPSQAPSRQSAISHPSSCVGEPSEPFEPSAATARARSVSTVVRPIHRRPPASAMSSKVRAQRLSRHPNPEPTRSRVASPPKILLAEPPVIFASPAEPAEPPRTFAAWGSVLLLLGLVDPSVLGIPLGITKDELVPTGVHVARVWGRASSGAEAEVGTRASWRVARSDRGGP
ncbi:hypothetical protein E6C27_scaffold1987G00120 [Cucumis melo var. makuwa]|uniref:Uncharacterized protein n=1 Tax=Cucumis melo var. makuwa TaxID=1194695 RepID=A0A5A7SPL4_CUCMM|nr:hypothetical protein E6C27_scaffold1987G00120 [Cucumis melo var. makuwa]